MNIGFKSRFVHFVRDGSKTHTIRAGERWRAGMRGDLWENIRQPKKFDEAGVQTAGQKLIFRSDIVKVEPIRVSRTWSEPENEPYLHEPYLQILKSQTERTLWPDLFPRPIAVTINGEHLANDEMDGFFWRDGFRQKEFSLIIGEYSWTGPTAQAYYFWREQLAKGSFDGQVIHWSYDNRFTDKGGKPKHG